MNCYVMNPKSGARMPRHLNRENTLFYPEARMTLYEQWTSGRPKDFHIVTDSPDLVGLYPRHEVFIWDEKEQSWMNPPLETYGTDIQVLRAEVFGIKSGIPGAVISREFVTNVMGHPLERT